MASIELIKDVERAIRYGHPWIYRDALVPASLQTGTVVDVVNRKKQFVARGLYDARSPIAVRVATLNRDEPIDDQFVRARLQVALTLRQTLLPKAVSAFRWCSGEGDFLPGIVVDLYARTAVLRIDGEAATVWRAAVVQAVVDLGRSFGLDCVYERWAKGGAVRFGRAPEETVAIVEHGAKFLVDVVRGQKNGFFLDQRENRRLLAPYCKGAQVCNLFGYTGGFSVYAALAGAERVVTVDSAKPALEEAKKNFACNRIDLGAHQFVVADAFAWLSETRDRFDLVISDPPSFAPSEKALPKALLAYRELHTLGLKRVRRGGLFAAASCSSHVGLPQFMQTVAEGAERAGVRARVVATRGQPIDHPSAAGFVHGRYLKFVLLTVD